MSTYEPGQRVHVNTFGASPLLDEGATYLKEHLDDDFFQHLVLLDDGRELLFRDHEVAPIAGPNILIENAKWADVINAMAGEVHNDKGRRYTITFDEA